VVEEDFQAGQFAVDGGGLQLPVCLPFLLPPARAFCFARVVLYPVVAALRYKWSNGQVEGQINRLKMTKRQMSRRAGPELLRARVLHAA